MTTWQKLLKVSLWIASAGLMLASSGLDGAYLAKLMPPRMAVLGFILNTVADVTSELGMYWYGRLQMDRSVVKQKRAKWLLVGQVILVGYAWLFSWRQLVPIIARVDPGAQWMAIVGAAFIPTTLVVVGYIQALLAGRIEVDKAEGPVVEQSKPAVEPVDLPVARIDDFRRVLGRLNGQRGSLTAEQLEVELAQDELGLPSASTVKRWLKLAQEE